MTTERTIARTLDRMRKNEHLPQDLVTLLAGTATLLAGEQEAMSIDLSDIDLSSPDLTGSPLCSPEGLPLDPMHFNATAGRVLEMILDLAGELPPAISDAAEKIKAAVDSRELDLGAAFRELAAGSPSEILTLWESRTPEAPAALRFVVKAAATPSLQAAAAALAEAAGLDPEQIRSHGACPVCGSLPDMLELRGKEGQRVAHCSFCSHTYRIRRLACACCGNEDAETLKYFTAEGENGFRVETCDACRTYVKTIDFRELDRQVAAPLNDLESLAMDILAGEEGFLRMAPSVWAI